MIQRTPLPRLVPLLVPFACAAALLAACDRASETAQANAPEPILLVGPPDTALVILRGDTIKAEVARTDEERNQGLMGRREVPDGTGMLFVFPDVRVRSFWMKNTLVPLDIAFLDTQYRIVDIQQMEPETEDFHTSAAPAQYALEVRQGWYGEHEWRVGDQVEVVYR